MNIASDEITNFNSVQGTGGSPSEVDPENSVDDGETGISGGPVSSWLQLPGELKNFRANTDNICEISEAFSLQTVLNFRQKS